MKGSDISGGFRAAMSVSIGMGFHRHYFSKVVDEYTFMYGIQSDIDGDSLLQTYVPKAHSVDTHWQQVALF